MYTISQERIIRGLTTTYRTRLRYFSGFGGTYQAFEFSSNSSHSRREKYYIKQSRHQKCSHVLYHLPLLSQLSSPCSCLFSWHPRRSRPPRPPPCLLPPRTTRHRDGSTRIYRPVRSPENTPCAGATATCSQTATSRRPRSCPHVRSRSNSWRRRPRQRADRNVAAAWRMRQDAAAGTVDHEPGGCDFGHGNRPLPSIDRCASDLS